jgi:hypothetical protein
MAEQGSANASWAQRILDMEDVKGTLLSSCKVFTEFTQPASANLSGFAVMRVKSM